MLKLDQSVLNKRVFTEKSYRKITNGFPTALECMRLLEKGEQCIDVGAAAGLMSTFFAKKMFHVHAYEPSPSFKETEKLTEQFDNVSVYNLAVSNTEGKKTFYIDNKRLSQNGFLDPGWGVPITVDTVMLDNQNHSNIGLIKIDTEGTELDVIKGATGIIKNNFPTFVVEIWDRNTKDPGSWFEYMEEMNYQMYWYHVKQKQIIRCKTVDECVRDVSLPTHPHDADFIFVHESRSTNDYTTCLISPVTI